MIKILFFIPLLLLTSIHTLADSTEELKKEIADLKQMIYLHDKRIRNLESLARKAPPSARTQASPSNGLQGWADKIKKENEDREAAYPERGWKNPYTWGKVKNGMSESQVIHILGPPTDKKVSYTTTLYYRGEKSGSGFISGNVVLNDDDRVIIIHKPVF